MRRHRPSNLRCRACRRKIAQLLESASCGHCGRHGLCRELPLLGKVLAAGRPACLVEILYRFHEMVSLGCEPYPMVYDSSRSDLKAFQRWAVTGLYRAVPWAEYRDPRLAGDRS